MGKKLTIFMFIDALGWEIVNKHGFCDQELPCRYPVRMQFGYSSTALPTILSGRKPTAHKHLSFYYYNPEKSPFKIFRCLMLQYLPGRIFNRWRVRHILSRIIKKLYGFTGYFELYSMPFDRLPFFDYCEKKDIFAAGGLAPLENLCDLLKEAGIPYLISDWRQPEEYNIRQMRAAVNDGSIEFGFLYTAGLDGFLHDRISDSGAVARKLAGYEQEVKNLLRAAENNYDDFTFALISDHGMTPLRGTCDLKTRIDRLGLKFGKDYAAVYDSTMARFWFFSPSARLRIMEVLAGEKNARLLTPAQKQEYGIDFPDNMFGEEILLCDPGIQIVPGDMSLRALAGMHGYSPGDKDSRASYLSNREPVRPPEWVGDYFALMRERISGN
ncbi:MAG: alkaline phosphatase family protein [Victivallaceae bacterium]|nr:alkaline phosphatase family protein [Victivallaceae bacterium]